MLQYIPVQGGAKESALKRLLAASPVAQLVWRLLLLLLRLSAQVPQSCSAAVKVALQACTDIGAVLAQPGGLALGQNGVGVHPPEKGLACSRLAMLHECLGCTMLRSTAGEGGLATGNRPSIALAPQVRVTRKGCRPSG